MAKKFKNLNRPRKFIIVASSILMFLALLAVPTFFIARHVELNSNSAPNQPPVQTTVKTQRPKNYVEGRPVALSIPSVYINVKVINGYYDKNTQQWTLTLDKAQYATQTALINNYQGNTLIYGHYRPEVFAYLHHIVPGANMTVTTDNGYVFTYQFKMTYAVKPTDGSIFNYKGPEQLTLQTCSGAFFQNRQMFVFQLRGFKKIS